MSVSERLQVLNVALHPGAEDVVVVDEVRAGYILIDALPEIIAVVEAAERIEGARSTLRVSTVRANARMYQALAALDVKLAGVTQEGPP